MESTKNIRVTLIGAGGVASYFLPVFLKSFNVEALYIYDNDILEVKNLDRQHFSPKGIGDYKALALMNNIRSFVPKKKMPKKLIIDPQYFIYGSELRDSNLIICMADNHPARLACLQAADAHDIPCVIACNEYFDSMAYYYKKDLTPDPRQRYPEILTSTEGDPIRCTGDALVSTPQLAVANLSAASKVLELLWTYQVIMPEIENDIYTLPYELETRLSGPICKQIKKD